MKERVGMLKFPATEEGVACLSPTAITLAEPRRLCCLPIRRPRKNLPSHKGIDQLCLTPMHELHHS